MEISLFCYANLNTRKKRENNEIQLVLQPDSFTRRWKNTIIDSDSSIFYWDMVKFYGIKCGFFWGIFMHELFMNYSFFADKFERNGKFS